MLVGLTGGIGRGVEHFRRDAVAVRNGIGLARAPAAAIGPEVDALHDGNGIVAGRDHHRHPQRELVAGLLDRLLIFDLHQHGFAGADIGDGVGEDVRPFLFGQRRLLSILLGLFVYGEVAVPNQSGHIYLVTNRHGQHRLITVARPTISGEMYGILTTLLAGRGSLLTPIAAPIAYLPIKIVSNPTFGRVSADDPNYAQYRQHLRRTTEEPFAMFLPG